MPNPVELSPAVDMRTDRVVLIMQDRPVVGMSAWLMDALAAAESAGLDLQLVTPPTTRLTFAARTLLFTGRHSRWVVNEPDGEGSYDGLNGTRLAWDGQLFAAVATGTQDAVDMSPAFVGRGLALPLQLWVTARVRYQALDSTVVGGATERLFADLAGAVPSGWGTAEPVTQPWNVDQLTALCRRRAPQPTWLAVVGGVAGRTAVGSVEVHRRPAGLEELATLAVAFPGALPAVGELRGIADRLARSFTLVSLFVQGARGAADTTVVPHWAGLPAPMAVAVGADAVREGAGADRGLAWALDGSDIGGIEPVAIGPTTSPSVWYPIGDGTSQRAWHAYSRLLARFAEADGQPPDRRTTASAT